MVLEVGTELWAEGRATLRKVKIARVTKTQAVADDGTRFDREQRCPHGFFSRGYHGYESPVYAVNTPELEEQNQRRITRAGLLKRCREIDFTKLTTEKLTKILEII